MRHIKRAGKPVLVLCPRGVNQREKRYELRLVSGGEGIEQELLSGAFFCLGSGEDDEDAGQYADDGGKGGHFGAPHQYGLGQQLAKDHV